jgi:hypothetical protein
MVDIIAIGSVGGGDDILRAQNHHFINYKGVGTLSAA